MQGACTVLKLESKGQQTHLSLSPPHSSLTSCDTGHETICRCTDNRQVLFVFQCEHVAVLHVNVKSQVLQGDFAVAAAAAGFLLYRCHCHFYRVKHLVFRSPVVCSDLSFFVVVLELVTNEQRFLKHLTVYKLEIFALSADFHSEVSCYSIHHLTSCEEETFDVTILLAFGYSWLELTSSLCSPCDLSLYSVHLASL